MLYKGRPTKLTDNIQDEITLMLKMGNYLEAAAAFAGVSKVTVYDWMKRGRREIERVTANESRKIRKSEQPFVDFLNAVEKAMAEAEIRDVQIIYNAGKADWKASAWRLERKYPDRWGRKDHHEVTGKDGGPIVVEDPKEKLLKRIEELANKEANQTIIPDQEDDHQDDHQGDE